MAAARGRAEGAALTQHVRIVSSAAAPEIDDDVYRGIVEQSLQGVLIFQDDRLVYSNPAITRISGYSADELRTFGLEALRERLHPDDRDRIWRQLEARLAGGGPSAPSELRFLRKDGAWRWVELLAHPLVHRGRPALQVSYVDVTERKLAEEALRESEERFSQVFRASPQPTLITAADGTVVDVNEAWEAMAGYSREEMVGRPASEARVFADVCQIPQMVQELLDTGRVRELEVPFLSKTGDQRHGLLSAESITLGGRPCVIWQGIDFTELKRARDALRAGEARFRLLTESASEFVTEVDETGRIVYLSPTFVEHLGYGGTTYEGIPQTDLIAATIHPADAGRIVAELARVMAGEPMPPALYRMRTGGGEWRWLETTGRRLAASDGSPRVVSITRDVTARVRADEERRELAARVLRSQKLEGLGLLAGGIAHDFNNLLVAIQGNAELALAALDVGHPARTLIEDAFRAAERGAGLTRELLAYAGKARVVIEPLDLVDLARDTVQLLRGATTRGAALAFECEGADCWVEGDATQLRQVAMNLVTNGSEALGEAGGSVRVRTEIVRLDRDALQGCLVVDGVEPGLYACLEVRDDGCGMDAETLERIFDPFFSTKFHGRGLGLASVLGIVRSHRGTLRVESEPGRGTTFRVYLPRTERRAAGCVSAPVATIARGPGTVLVVDDEPTVRAVACRMLEAHGFEVLQAADGDSALEIARARAAELRGVLLDLAMPGMDGDRAFAALREIRGDLPVVFVSGHGEERLARRLRGRSGVAALAKPFRADALLQKLDEAVRASQARSEAAAHARG
jgi:PAS domain S-box-containing protein